MRSICTPGWPATGMAILTPAQNGGDCCGSPGWTFGLAMVVAGAVNAAMLLVAALNMQSRGGIGSIEAAYAAVHDTVSPLIAVFFAVGLLASGLASASVGAYAGAMIMQGLLHRSIPMVLRGWRRWCPHC